MSNLELLDRAAGSTTCQILSAAGGALIDVGVWTLWTGKASLVPFGAGALSLLASNYLCPDQEMASGNKVPSADGCTKIKDGVGQLQVAGTASDGVFYDALDSSLWPHNDKVTEITESFYEPFNGEWRTVLRYMTTEGPQEHIQYGISPEESAAAFKSRIRPTTGTCDGTSSDPVNPPPEIYEPISYTDNVTNCTYIVTLQGFAQESEGGTVQPVYLVEGATQQRNDGGRMGGCNFPPTIYTPGGGGGGGGVYVPTPVPLPDPDGDVPWWVPALAGALGGAVLNQLADAIDDALAPKFEPASFTLIAPCDVDANGNPENRTWDFAEGTFQERMNAHQVALMEILQQHLNWKTPICREQRPEKRGTWISTNWRSDADSPNSNRPLRKLFRYRSESTRTNNELQAYWSDFEWTSGNVCVIHKGAWWGTPQIWASTSEEGKRVIRRAGAEAGLDPDQTGEWLISSSDSPRYGVSLKMRLAEESGERWVTRREGASGFPEL